MFIPTISLLFLNLLPTQWHIFKDFNGKFSIEIPCEKMEEKVQTIQTAIGNLEYHTFVCTPEDKDAENKVYIISYVDYPQEMLHPDSSQLKNEVLETSIASSVESLNGTLIYKDNIELKGEKGLFWRTDYNRGNAIMKTKAFIVKNRLYMVQVATQKARSRNLEADKYLNSFTWF